MPPPYHLSYTQHKADPRGSPHAADKVRAGDQPQDRKSPWAHRAGAATSPADEVIDK